jgi:hypothetical protein
MPCPTLTAEDRLRLEGYLRSAEDAYHKAMIGGGVREFRDQNGEAIVYSATDRRSLLAYINRLRIDLGKPPMCGSVAPPAGVYL